MSETDYGRFLEWAIVDYAQAQVQAGTWQAADAQRLSEETFGHLLPDGPETPDQHLCSIIDRASDETVGWLWYAVREREGDRYLVLNEFLIFEPFRRRGYGTAALTALEKEARTLGMSRIVLHVFGHNTPARALYAKAGYAERNVTMVKGID